MSTVVKAIEIYFGENDQSQLMTTDLIEEKNFKHDGVNRYKVDDELGFYSFNELSDNSVCLAVNMKLPSYFEHSLDFNTVNKDGIYPEEQLSGRWTSTTFTSLKGEYNGLFLIAFDNVEELKQPHNFRNLRKVAMLHSDQGCAKFLPMHEGYYFHSNNNYFFPMLMDDYSLVYFVCEERRRREWVEGINVHGYNIVSLYEPPVRDATLGIYMTRRASLTRYEQSVGNYCDYNPCN